MPKLKCIKVYLCIYCSDMAPNASGIHSLDHERILVNLEFDKN